MLSHPITFKRAEALTDASLYSIIRQRMLTQGPISFHDFMEMALYYPLLGYYNSGKEKIGKEGDYYTSADLSSLQGRMLGRQLEEMWRLLDKGPFTIVELGAGTGRLCFDILDYLRTNQELYSQLHYYVVEQSPAMRSIEKTFLPADKVTWFDSIEDIKEVTGCILSNELLDNFPVHRVIMQDKLQEVYVDYDKEFIEVLKPASDEMYKYLDELNIILPEDHSAEVNLKAIEWIRQLSYILKKGFIITIDYGYTVPEFLASGSRETVISYHQHKTNHDYYQNIGVQDITAHVNFSALHHWGKRFGLDICGYTSLGEFLHALGLVAHIREIEQQDKLTLEDKKKLFLCHTLLSDMGDKYKVLIQHKGLVKPMLSGLFFASEIEYTPP